MISWKLSYMTFGYSLYVLYQKIILVNDGSLFYLETENTIVFSVSNLYMIKFSYPSDDKLVQNL